MLRWTSLVVPLLFLAACSDGSKTARPYAYASLDTLDEQELRMTLAAHRQLQLSRLETYSAVGKFPHNWASPAPVHLFRDDAGNYCAVANLVHQDGEDALVDSIVHHDNALAVADVASGQMLEWIEGSGLTKEELVRIQLPAVYVRPRGAAPQPGAADVANNRWIERTREIREPAGVSEEQLQAIVREHLAQVLRELRANERESLDRAAVEYFAEKAWRMKPARKS